MTDRSSIYARRVEMPAHVGVNVNLRSTPAQVSIEMALKTFVDAARPMLRWRDYRGHDSRRAFWTFAVLAACTVVAGRLTDLFLFGSVPGRVPPFFVLIAVLVLLPALVAIGVRRLHDTHRSGWRLLLAAVPIVGWIALTLWWCLPTREVRGH